MEIVVSKSTEGNGCQLFTRGIVSIYNLKEIAVSLSPEGNCCFLSPEGNYCRTVTRGKLLSLEGNYGQSITLGKLLSVYHSMEIVFSQSPAEVVVS